MIDRLKKLLVRFEAGDDSAIAAFSDRQTAAAALLVEAATLDGHLGEAEEATIRALLGRRFDLEAEEVEGLLEEGRSRATEANHLHRFTRTIKDSCSYKERLAMIEMLWEVAYADGVLHAYEANLLRRIGGLLYVTDRDRGEARKRVLDRLGLPSSGGGRDSAAQE